LLGLTFGGFVWWQLGPVAAKEYVTGFVVEKSLAMDNVFVIAMIFSYFAIPRLYQHRVLFWGILGVILLRGLMIGFGAALVSNFGWVLYLFAAFLIFTGVQMWRNAESEFDVGDSAVLKWVKRRFRVTEALHEDRFFVRQPDAQTGRIVTFITPLFLALVMVEFVDLVFAVDSVPAIFAITTDPFIVYTSNIFAILGLRALYFALAAMVHRFHYLKYALSVLLVFIGSKIFLADLAGFPGGKFPTEWSLGITFAILSVGVGYSLWKTRGGPLESHGA
jgi:tellurite resistance protein TerC